MHWIQDIVPNHMAFHPQNIWLADLLKNGSDSIFVDFFDVNLEPTEKLMLPFLAKGLEKSVAEKTIELIEHQDQYLLEFAGLQWPISSTSELALKKGTIAKDDIQHILEQQHYRPCAASETNEYINYRRFFLVNSLICLRMEDPKVWTTYHKLILECYQQGLFQGFRIDHIDGLSNPKGYLDQLRQATGPACYITVEKILATNENLPKDWACEGTTGYEFLSMANQLATQSKADSRYQEIYESIMPETVHSDLQQYQAKSMILDNYMGGELKQLTHTYQNLQAELRWDILSTSQIREDIRELLLSLHVYRYYPEVEFPTNDLIGHLKKMSQRQPANQIAINCYRQLQLSAHPLPFLKRCMQYTGPVMAKGVEDTLMYTDNKHIGLNDVGGAIGQFGLLPQKFHDFILQRQSSQNYPLNTLSTHDTKRGEDVRAKLQAFTHRPDRYQQLWLSYQQQARDHATDVHPNDHYHLFQTLLGIWRPHQVIDSVFRGRLNTYVQKFLREGKERSFWEHPNQGYETLVTEFLENLLNEKNTFILALEQATLDLEQDWLHSIKLQLVLQATCPGAMDCYQGTELLDLNLVDPDNRQPVDYLIRKKLLQKAEKNDTKNTELDIKKLHFKQQLFQLRKTHKDLFIKGTYAPLDVIGPFSNRIIAYHRKTQKEHLIIVASIDSSLNLNHEEQNTYIKIPTGIPQIGHQLLEEGEVYINIQDQTLDLKTLFKKNRFSIIRFSSNPKRSSGILLPLSALPNETPIGNMGKSAKRFIDLMQESGQRIWQLLPINPTSPKVNYSPYSAHSSYAGNHLFIDVTKMRLQNPQPVSNQSTLHSKVDYQLAEAQQLKQLRQAYQQFHKDANDLQRQQFRHFCNKQQHWLVDYALFEFYHGLFGGRPWPQWPAAYKSRNVDALAETVEKHQNDIAEFQWRQYQFYQQWEELHQYAKNNHVELLGDLPFYVAHDSADVWANQTLFQLDDTGMPTASAGAPPDDFAKHGQNWRLPLYNWQAMAKDHYQWWMDRIAHQLELFDLVRIDHFRAIERYWLIPDHPEQAAGKWQQGPGQAFMDCLLQKFPASKFIAEDLGQDIENAQKIRKANQIPGMTVLQFGFGVDFPHSQHLPHNFSEIQQVHYFGTHDNPPIISWLENQACSLEKQNLAHYTDTSTANSTSQWAIIRNMLNSTASMVIFQFQDISGSTDIINRPGTIDDNWTYRLKEQDLLEHAHWQKLKSLTTFSGRL